MIYACDQWPVAHRCDTAEREGCTPERVYMDVIHIVDARTGDGTTKNLHPGPREACTLKQCAVEKDMTDPWEPPAGPLPPWPGPLAGDEDE
jgi:hypothetical protein